MKYFLACSLFLFSHQFSEASPCHRAVNQAVHRYHTPKIHRPKKITNVEETVLKHLEQRTYKYSEHALKQMKNRDISFEEVREALVKGVHREREDSFDKDHDRWGYPLVDESNPWRPIKVVVSFDRKRRKKQMRIVTAVINIRETNPRRRQRRPFGF